MKKYSVVIPVFNEEIRIRYLIANLEEIEYPKTHFEVIVVDYGSTDATGGCGKNR